jgi:ATP-binding cassette, subfamily D (ALD), member 3
VVESQNQQHFPGTLTYIQKFIKHSEGIMNKKLYMGVFDSMLVKYGAFMVGYGVLALPVFGSNSEQYNKKVGDNTGALTRDYIRNSSLLINLAKAVGKLLISYQQVQNLAGYTTLIYEMKEVLDDLVQGKFVRAQVVGDKKTIRASSFSEDDKGVHEETEDYIVLDKVPVITPNGDVLTQELSLEIHRGMSTVISGPNGCGKSSLFRILSGLWPLAGGVLKRPHMDKLFYIPQRPYLPPGTLRDQIIYPHSKERITRDDEYIR